MFIFINFLLAVAKLLDIVITIYYLLIIARAIISWVRIEGYSPVTQFLIRATEPVLAPIRKFLPYSSIDFSPVIAFLVLIFIKSFLVRSLYDLARALG